MINARFQEQDFLSLQTKKIVKKNRLSKERISFMKD
jgi:hypothetical protein